MLSKYTITSSTLQNTSHGKKVVAALMKSVHKYDRTRPITCAMNGNWSKARKRGWDATMNFQRLRGFEAVEDVVGCNYQPYNYALFHNVYPTLRMVGSEIRSSISDRGVYTTDIAAGHISAFAYLERLQSGWPAVERNKFIAGGFIWTGFDYRGEPMPCDWPSINSHFGALDMCGFPKDVALYYKAWWGDKPLRLVPAFSP